MANKMKRNPFREDKKYQFNVGYMTPPMLNKHRTYKEQVIKMFESEIHIQTINCIKIFLMKKRNSYFDDDVFVSTETQLCSGC